jgi:hypothetical protein
VRTVSRKRFPSESWVDRCSQVIAKAQCRVGSQQRTKFKINGFLY